MIMMLSGSSKILQGKAERGEVIHLDLLFMDIVERRGKKVTAMFVQEQATMTVQ